MKVAILIPCYNNAKTILQVADQIKSVLNERFPKDNFHLLVANDGSTDETNQKLQYCLLCNPPPEEDELYTSPIDFKHPASKVRFYVDSWSKNEGVGATTKKGITILSGEKFDYFIKLDGDGQHDPSLLPEMLSKRKSGADLVIASRFHKQSEQVETPLDRLLLNRVFAGLIKEITGWKITDSRSGFMGMKWTHAKAMAPQLITKRYGIPMEIILRLWKIQPKAKVVEIPHSALYGGETLTEKHRRRYQDSGETIEQKSARVAEAYAAVLRVLNDMKVNANQIKTPS